MTTRLEVNKTHNPVSSGPVLSPKILESFASKFKRTAHYAEQDLDMALGLYMQGVVPLRTLAREAVNRLEYPVTIVAARVQAGGNIARECIVQLAALSRGQYRAIDMGDARLCLVLEGDADQDEACTMLKKAARSLGGTLNIGLREAVGSAEQLPTAYVEAECIAKLGMQLWSKPYIYRQSDMGLTLGLLGSESARNHVGQESQRILDALARPKVLLPTLKLFFASNMSPTEVARLGKVHRNTVVYRLDKIRQLTGLDPLDFNDATQLYLASVVHDIARAGVVTTAGSALGESDDLAEKAIISLLTGSGMSETRVRVLLESSGLVLPQDFSLYLVASEDDMTNVGVNTTLSAQVKLRQGLWLLVGLNSARQSAKVAAGLADRGSVVYATSSQLGSQLGSAIPVLINGQAIVAQCWPNLQVAPLDSYAGLLALMESSRVRKYAQVRAQAIVDRLRLVKQLETTASVLLDTSLNLTLAARRLKVHRNTLIYRVGRIRHLTGYDLTRFEDAVQIRLAFLLAELT